MVYRILNKFDINLNWSTTPEKNVTALPCEMQTSVRWSKYIFPQINGFQNNPCKRGSLSQTWCLSFVISFLCYLVFIPITNTEKVSPPRLFHIAAVRLIFLNRLTSSFVHWSIVIHSRLICYLVWLEFGNRTLHCVATFILYLSLLLPFGVDRFQPTKQDKAEFEAALRHAAGGHLPVRMWLFYEFLVHNGELEGSPRLDKNLFFYCEVLKFKVSIRRVTVTLFLHIPYLCQLLSRHDVGQALRNVCYYEFMTSLSY